MPKKSAITTAIQGALLADVRGLILTAREGLARSVNAGLVALCWQVGQRIRKDILREKRAEYGAEIVATLSRQLAAEFSAGYDAKSLARMVQFSEVFPDSEIVATLSRQLGWSHFKELLPLRDPLQRDFYAEKSDERVEVFELESRGIRIAEYLTELPPRDLLAKKLHDAVRLARERFGEKAAPAKQLTASRTPREKLRNCF